MEIRFTLPIEEQPKGDTDVFFDGDIIGKARSNPNGTYSFILTRKLSDERYNEVAKILVDGRFEAELFTGPGSLTIKGREIKSFDRLIVVTEKS